MRAIIPCKALPGPHSVKSSAPSATIFCTLDVQRTGLVSCEIKLALISAAAVCGFPSTFWYTAHFGSLKSVFSIALQFVLGRLHQRRMECSTHLQRQCPFGTGSFQPFARSVNGTYITRNHQLTGAVIISRNNHIACRTYFTANLFYLSSDRPMIVAIGPGATSQAFCIAIARA